MNKLGVVFLLMVLVFVPVMPMAASPGRDSATGTPTPPPPPVGGTKVGSTSPPAMDEALVRLARGFNVPTSENGLDLQALEDLRRELLGVADELNGLLDVIYPSMQYYAQLNGEKLPANPKVPRQLIQELTHEELLIGRISFGDTDLKAFRNDIRTLKSQVLMQGEGFAPADKGPGPPLNSFTIIPTPTPGSPGIEHLTLSNANTKNIQAGDIFIKEGGSDAQTPKYPIFPCFTNTRPPNWLALTVQGVVEGLRLVTTISKTMCDAIVITCTGGGTNAIKCHIALVIDLIKFAADTALGFLNFCIGRIDSAERGASFKNTQILHADLDDHDKYLADRANTIDLFLFDFRNLNLRLNIEANLASPEDDPNSLFALPSNVCIKDDPQPGGFNVEVIGLPNDPMTQDKLRRCGLLEVVSDTVRSAIDMNLIAGQDVNNAAAEFDAAVAHFDNGEWKLAFARFRKAYREAVRP